MFRILLLLFIAIPLLEIYLLIQIGEEIGALPTVALVIVTAMLGVWLLRWQGLTTLAQVQQSMAQGQIPAIPLIEGLFLLMAGALLLTPGFFTDALGFALLVPPLRQALARALLQQGWWRMAGKTQWGSSRPAPPNTIEGEFTREDDKNDRFPR
ncbi:MAG: FxsA family protein [Gammaproteobacteria bacterium]